MYSQKLCQQSVDYICLCLFLGSLLCSVGLCLFLMPLIHCSHQGSFMVYFKNRQYNDSSFVLLNQNCLCCSGSFAKTPYEFQNFFPISGKITIKILIWIALNLQINFSSMDILTILIFLFHEQGYIIIYLSFSISFNTLQFSVHISFKSFIKFIHKYFTY